MRSSLASLTLAAFAALLTACGEEVLIEVPEEPEPEPREQPEPEPEPQDDPPPPPPPPPPPTTSGDDCVVDDDCGAGAECEAGTCVGIGVLQVTLTFNMDTDLDLHVFTPSGEEIYFGNSFAAGGELDVDQCVSSCGPGTHVENVFFSEVQSGPYTAWAENYDGREGGTFRIEVSGAAEAVLEGFVAAEFFAATPELNWFVP